MKNPRPIEVKPWDIIRLHGRTDRYRVYTYEGRQIFVGMNSDTATDANRDVPVELIERET